MKDGIFNDHRMFKVFFNPVRYYRDMDIDLKFIILFTFFTLIFIYVPYLNVSILRIAFGMVFVVFLPGYAFIALIFPGKSGISSIERALYSFVFSIVIVPFIGLIFNYTIWGVRLEPITLCLIVFTTVCTLLANKRRQNIVKEERFSVDIDKSFAGVKKMIFLPDESRRTIAFSVLLFFLLLASIGQISYMVITSHPGEKYTEFYITGQDDRFANYSTSFRIGEQKPVTVNIVNHEHEDMFYDLIVRLNYQDRSSILYSGRINVANNQSFEQKINIKPDMVGNGLKLSFELFKDGNLNVPYRECNLWLNVSYTKNSIT